MTLKGIQTVILELIIARIRDFYGVRRSAVGIM